MQNLYWSHKVKKTASNIRNSSCHYILHMRGGACVISIWLSKCPDASSTTCFVNIVVWSGSFETETLVQNLPVSYSFVCSCFVAYVIWKPELNASTVVRLLAVLGV